MSGRVIYLPWIERSMLQADPEARFVFGDNAERWGLGGQAKEMRGEPNAIGVATLWSPGQFYPAGEVAAVCVVLDFYPLENGNRFAKVTMRGQVDRSDDRKWAAAELTVDVELTFPAFVTEVIRWAWDACKADASVEGNVTSGDFAKNASSGDYATNASSGDYAYNEATGQHSVISGAGRGTQYKGAVGVWISAAEYTKIGGAWRCIGFATGQAGHDGVPANTWLIAKGGRLVPA